MLSWSANVQCDSVRCVAKSPRPKLSADRFVSALKLRVKASPTLPSFYQCMLLSRQVLSRMIGEVTLKHLKSQNLYDGMSYRSTNFCCNLFSVTSEYLTSNDWRACGQVQTQEHYFHHLCTQEVTGEMPWPTANTTRFTLKLSNF